MRKNPVERENVDDKLQMCHLHNTRRLMLNTDTNTAPEDLRGVCVPSVSWALGTQVCSPLFSYSLLKA